MTHSIKMNDAGKRCSPGSVEQLAFGRPVENIAASEDNPTKRGFFVRSSGSMVEYASPLGVHHTPRANIRILGAAQASAEPVAWIVLSDETGNTRIWWRDKELADVWCAKHDMTATPLYAAPPAISGDAVREATIEECAKIAENYFVTHEHQNPMMRAQYEAFGKAFAKAILALAGPQERVTRDK